MPSFRFITASEWGGTWKRPPVREALEDPECYIHHTAGNPHKDKPAEQALRIINDYAKNSKGYSFLDYDYMVHWEEAKDLYTIAEGRGEWLSAATVDRNELGEAICVMGYFHPGSQHSEHPKPGHIQAVAMGIVKMIERKLLAPNPEILGHFQNKAFPVPQTGCPGDYFKPFIPEVRSLVQYFQTPTYHPGGTVLHTFDPKKRLVDTRLGNGAKVTKLAVNVPDVNGKQAKTAIVNVTSVTPNNTGFIRVFGQHEGETSDLNFAGSDVQNSPTIVRIVNGKFNIYSTQPTHLVVDLLGLVE